MSWSYDLSLDDLNANALSNDTPAQFFDHLKALFRMWSAAHFQPFSMSKESYATASRNCKQRMYLYPVVFPVGGIMSERVFVSVLTVINSNASTVNRIRYITLNQDKTYTQAASYTSRTFTTTSTSFSYPSRWGVVCILSRGDDITDTSGTSQIQTYYSGHNTINITPTNTSITYGLKPTSHAASQVNIDDAIGYPCDLGETGPLTGASFAFAPQYLEKLLYTPLMLWMHVCTPLLNDPGNVMSLRPRSGATNLLYAPTGYVDPNVIKMSHFVPYREGAPEFTNKLRIAIWEIDAFRQNEYTYGDFQLSVDTGAGAVDAEIIEFGTYADGKGRLILATIPPPKGKAGSRLMHGRRFWSVKITRFGRPAINGKGDPDGMFEQCVGSITAWLGGQDWEA